MTHPTPPTGGAYAFYARALERVPAATAAVVLLTAVLGAFALRVHPDFAVEYLFPEAGEARANYDRYKEIFPYDEARALVMLEAPDLWTAQGLGRIAALERDLGAIKVVTRNATIAERLAGAAPVHVPAVKDVEGPLSVKQVVDAGDETVKLEKLFPRPDLPPDEIRVRAATATADRLFRWRLTPPEGRAVAIRVTLHKDIAPKDETRNRFYYALRETIAKHERPDLGQKITISGLPVVRSEYTEMIAGDQATLVPLAMLVILALLYLTFRSAKEVAAAFVTVLASIVWTRGAMGIFGYPEQVLTSIVPTVVMIISITDTVHILSHYKGAVADGKTHEEALAYAMADSAWPCFVTEVTIGIGFLSLYFVDILMISQFGVATAAGMMLTWTANVTVLPLAIHALKPSPAAASRHTAAEKVFARFIAWIERQVTRRPGRVMAAAAVIAGLGIFFGTRIEREYYGLTDGLRPDSAILKEVRYAEATFGGFNPLVVLVEAKPGAPDHDPLLEPEAMRLLDRLADMLERTFPKDVKSAISVADYVKKAHRIFAGPEAADREPIPSSRSLIAQELLFVDDGKILDDLISDDRRTAAVTVMIPDVGSTRIRAIVRELKANIAREEQAMAGTACPVKLTVTGIISLTDAIYANLVDGLLRSLAGAVAVSFLAFCIVLRSWRLGLIALVPNVLPLALTFGFMGLAGIELTPTTVIVFSITLVIADDDTVQYFTRFLNRFHEERARGEKEPHAAAALGTLREAGLPMFITSCAVSLGFLTLMFSKFLRLADFGVLIGVSLFTAIFADLFISPILISRLRPPIPPRGEGAP